MSPLKNKNLNNQAFDQFMDRPNGTPLLDFTLPFVPAHIKDMLAYERFKIDKSQSALAALFPRTKQKNLESLRFAEGQTPFSGEWFSKITFGNTVSLGRDAKLMAHGRLVFGDNTTIGNDVLLVTAGHPIHPSQRHLVLVGLIETRENTLIGSNAILIGVGKENAQLTIGANAIIIPNALITKDVSAYTVAGGVDKTLLEGKHYFKRTPTGNSLQDRLTTDGLKKLSAALKANKLNIDPKDDLATPPPQKSHPDLDLTIFNAGKTVAEIAKFFASSNPEILNNCVFTPPLYFRGAPPIMKPGCILNSDTRFAGNITLGECTLVAPHTQIQAEEDASITFEDNVWLGTRTSITATKGQHLVIGTGSLLAAGAQVTQSVNPMSIIVGAGQCLRTITKADIHNIPQQWNDRGYCLTQRTPAVKLFRKMYKNGMAGLNNGQIG